MALLTLVATGIATMVTIAVKAVQAARVQTSSTVLAGQKLEALRALMWTVDANGQPRSDFVTDMSTEPSTGGGSGLGPSPANALDDNVPGFVDFLDERGRWLGTGTSPPVNTRFVRRWLVKPLPEHPNDVVILQVRVTTAARSQHARGARVGQDALLTTVYSRKAH